MDNARLHPAAPSLAACVYLAVERDTRRLQLTDTQRFNYYPATPFPSISWILDGELRMLEGSFEADGPRFGRPLASAVFCGPTRRPSVSWAPGAVHALTVSFYPEAMAQLLGISIEEHVGAILPLHDVLPAGHMQQLMDIDFVAGASPNCQVQAILARLWRSVAHPPAAPGVRGWLALLSARVTSKAGGAGQRQVQRLVKCWTGQSLRDLQLYARVEGAMMRGAAAAQGQGMDLAALAADAGFADQSHLGREVRRVTGLSPARLNDMIKHDEAFWMYRLLG